MTIASKLTELNTVKGEIHDAIEAQGVSLTGVEFRDYATKIAEIEGGGATDYNVVYNEATKSFELENTWYEDATELTIAGLSGSGKDVKFSPDGKYCAVGSSASPYIYVFSVSGDTYTKLNNPSNLPPSTVNSIVWGSNSRLYCSTSTSLSIYDVEFDTITQLAISTTAEHVGVLSYNYENDFLIISSGGVTRNYDVISGVGIPPILHCTYTSSINGDAGIGTLTGTASGGAAVSGGRLNLTGGTSKFVTYNGITFDGLHTKGTVIFRYTPNAAGASNYIFSMANGNNRQNCLEVRVAGGGQLVVTHWNSAGGGQATEVASVTFSSGTTYEIAVSWNSATPSCMAYVNGTRVGNWTTPWGTRTNSLANLIVGSVIDNPTVVTADFYLDDLFLTGDQILTDASYVPYNGVYASETTLSNKNTTFSVATGTTNDIGNKGDTLAIAGSSSPYLYVYNYDLGTNQYNKVTNPATLPTASANSVSWNQSGTKVAVAYGTKVAVYSFDGTNLTYLTEITTSATSQVGWFNDNNLMITNTTDGLKVYDSDWNLMTTPAGININTRVASFGRHLVGTSTNSTYLELWNSYPSGSFVDKNLKVIE